MIHEECGRKQSWLKTLSRHLPEVNEEKQVISIIVILTVLEQVWN